MAGTILEYLKTYGETTFEEKAFGEVDSLILCQFAYLKFDGMVPGVHENKPFVTLKELAEHPQYDNLFKNVWFEKRNRQLFEKMYASKRFGNLKLNFYINIIEKEWETQFSAITFLLENGSVYIGYRGTDENIVGWKEDLNMSFQTPVPGQAYSLKYLNMVAEKFNQPFFIGGHSKGGNLAVYAAMNSKKEVRDRILAVYNMDGPGFPPEVLNNCDYASIEARVIKILPHSSVVGLIFEQSEKIKIVKSKALGLLQHDPFSWSVKYGRFVDAGDFWQGHKFANDTMNEWILSLDAEKRRIFVDALYQVISAAEKDKLTEIPSDWKRSSGNILGALKDLDEQTTEIIKEVVKAYIMVSQMRIMNEISRGQEKIKSKIIRRKESTKAKELPK